MHTEQRRDRGPRRSSRIPVLLLLAGVIAAGAVLYYIYWPHESTPPAASEEAIDPEIEAPAEAPAVAAESPPQAERTAEPTTTEVEPAVVLPALSESDDYVRERVAELALPNAWTEQSELMDRSAVLLLNVANGHVPRKQLAFLLPEDAFSVDEVGERRYIPQRSYDRYNALVTTLTSVPPEAFARLYNELRPLLGQALTQLGEPPDPAPLLDEALAALEAAPSIRAPIEVEVKGALYAFKDPELEALPDVQKQLIRLGPDNLEKLKAYGKAVSDLLRAD